jgi:[acyl-carrier-protein] S-malonyltransferase
LAALGGTTFVELGPGGVLSGLAKRSVADIETVSVAEPDDLDRLMDLLAKPETQRVQVHDAGEHLYMSERVVVSPGGGIFFPAPSRCTPPSPDRSCAGRPPPASGSRRVSRCSGCG